MLRFIKENNCPVCGCDVVIEEKIQKDVFGNNHREHCNGEKWETRKFACGCELEYIPNFSKTIVSDYYICTNNDEYRKIREKREAFINDLRESVSNNKDIDEDYRSKVLDRLSYI